jgi:hypothetical protein
MFARIRTFLNRPLVQRGIEAVRSARQASGRALIGDNSGAPNPLRSPAAYSKLIAYGVAALATLVGRWWGVDVSVEFQAIVVELLVSIVGGWAVWRIPNQSAAPTTADQ